MKIIINGIVQWLWSLTQRDLRKINVNDSYHQFAIDRIKERKNLFWYQRIPNDVYQFDDVDIPSYRKSKLIKYSSWIATFLNCIECAEFLFVIKLHGILCLILTSTNDTQFSLPKNTWTEIYDHCRPKWKTKNKHIQCEIE